MREGMRERKRSPRLLSSILGVSLIGIRRVKSLSLSIRRGLCMCTKKKGLHRRSKGGDFGKSRISG